MDLRVIKLNKSIHLLTMKGIKNEYQRNSLNERKN